MNRASASLYRSRDSRVGRLRPHFWAQPELWPVPLPHSRAYQVQQLASIWILWCSKRKKCKPSPSYPIPSHRINFHPVASHRINSHPTPLIPSNSPPWRPLVVLRTSQTFSTGSRVPCKRSQQSSSKQERMRNQFFCKGS